MTRAASKQSSSIDAGDVERSFELVDESVDEGNENSADLIEGIESLSQAITESYGTGVQELPGYAIEERSPQARGHDFHEASATLTGGDIDANYEQANAVGDEAVGGTVITPDMDIVDNLGKAVGLEMSDLDFLHTSRILERRDQQRWELEPTSAEDYDERQHQEFLDQ